MKIENIVSSGSLNCEIDLRKLSEECDQVVYGKNRYPGGYVKFDGHSVTIYRTGKYIMPGMKSIDEMDSCFQKLLSILSSYIDVSKAVKPEIRNIVCSSEIGSELDLSLLYLKLSQMDYDVVYEPESFPGLILKVADITYNVFQSGKYLILGCQSESSALESDQRFQSLISELSSH